MNARMALTVAVLLVGACSKPDDRTSLAGRVEFACQNLTGELRLAVGAYKQYAGWMAEGRMSVDQQRRAEQALPYGATEVERQRSAHGIYQQLWACTAYRAIDHARANDIQVRLYEVLEKLRWGTDPAETARALGGIHAISTEINNLPLRD